MSKHSGENDNLKIEKETFQNAEISLSEHKNLNEIYNHEKVRFVEKVN